MSVGCRSLLVTTLLVGELLGITIAGLAHESTLSNLNLATRSTPETTQVDQPYQPISRGIPGRREGGGTR